MDYHPRPPMFSRRTPSLHAENRLTAALTARGRPYVDLTVTNPTLVGLETRPERLAALADPRGQVYAPEPKGLLSARQAVAALYAREGVDVDAGRVVLTASSSEAYSWLFKLLCEPGDAVLVPAPSYPLLDALAELETASLHRYPLDAHHGWAVSTASIAARVEELAAAGRRVAAVVVVNPNNPTGTGISRGEATALLDLAATHGFGVISDEVFADDVRARPRDGVAVLAGLESDALVFSLGGLSKTLVLPQLKLGFLLANGPAPLLAAALERLEWIADTFLSVGTPVQRALPELLARRLQLKAPLTRRLASNLTALRSTFGAGSPVSVLPCHAGWSAVLRVPRRESEEELVLDLLETHDVLVQPGYFYEFPHEAFLVLSLVTEPVAFAEGLARIRNALA